MGVNPFDWTAAGFLRGERADRHLWIAGDLDAETATDIGSFDADTIDVDVQMGGEKLNGERGEGIVAGVVDAFVFGIPLSDDDVIFQRRAGEAVEVQAIDVDDVSSVFEGAINVAVFEDAVPNAVGSGLFVQQALILQRLFTIDERVGRFVLDLQNFGGVIGDGEGRGDHRGYGFALTTRFGDGAR